VGKKVGRRWRLVLVVLAAWAAIQLMYMVVDGLHDFKGNADIAVVLGNRVNADGTLSPVLRARVDKALRLYRERRVPLIMVSGGRGEKGDDPPRYPEGLAMKQYLVSQGVPTTAIVEDNDGENTYLTAKDYVNQADRLKVHSVIVVSSFYHITRIKYIFRKLGARDVHGSSADVFFWNDLLGLPRDALAFYKYLLVY
jgi:vancomycin permeability regulator SanA